VVCDYELVLQVEIFSLVIGVMEEQRVAIKFCVKAGKRAVETIELIKGEREERGQKWSSFDYQNRRKRGICSSSADRRPSYHSPNDC